MDSWKFHVAQPVFYDSRKSLFTKNIGRVEIIDGCTTNDKNFKRINVEIQVATVNVSSEKSRIR